MRSDWVGAPLCGCTPSTMCTHQVRKVSATTSASGRAPPTAPRDPPALGEGRMDTIPEAAPQVATSRPLPPAADGMHRRLHRALSEVLRVAAVAATRLGLSQMTRPVRCPMTVPAAGGTDIAAFRSCAALATRIRCQILFRCERLPASDPFECLSSFSQTLETRSGKIVRPKSSKAHHAAYRDGRNPSRNMDHGSSPRLYTTRSRSISSTSPPKLKSSG
jgi:hypothetical protein